MSANAVYEPDILGWDSPVGPYTAEQPVRTLTTAVTAADLAQRLDARKNGNGWTAKCPGHDDKTPSLSISEGRDGRVLLFCHAGCTTEAIVAAMGLRMADLMPETTNTPRPAPAKPSRTFTSAEEAAKTCTPQGATLQKVYLYPKNGQEFGMIARYRIPNGKKFLQFHATPAGWTTGAPTGKWPLYREKELPTIGQINIFEGEQCVDAAIELGMAATCSAGGSKAAAKSDWTILSGREVVILPDNDTPGEAYAADVTRILGALNPPARVRIVRLPGLPEAGDIVDFIEARDAATPEDLRAEIESLAASNNMPAPISALRDGHFSSSLPLIVDAAQFTTDPISTPPEVVAGILHRGSKAVYGGPSKAFKTWTLLDLCLAVSTGSDWLGFKTIQGPVLYINFELQPFAVYKRLLAIAKDRGCEIPSALRLWNLRGFSRPLCQLLPELLSQIQGEKFALIVPDPIYKTLAGRNENDAGDIAELCDELEHVAIETGAAVAFGAHFAKGNASGKEHIDRVSGSGVWARDPDSIITATTHEQDGAFSVEMTLRNFPPPPSFVIRWDYPRMRRDDDLDPKALRQPKYGRNIEFSPETIVEHLTAPMTPTAWLKACQDEIGISRRTFFRRVEEAHQARLIERDGKEWKRHSAQQ